MKRRTYSLNEFSEEEIKLLHIYLKKVLFGYVKIIADDKINEIIEQLRGTTFETNDNIHLNFEVITLGNDILAALGVARNEIEERNNK